MGHQTDKSVFAYSTMSSHCLTEVPAAQDGALTDIRASVSGSSRGRPVTTPRRRGRPESGRMSGGRTAPGEPRAGAREGRRRIPAVSGIPITIERVIFRYCLSNRS